jgi:hypothetical protein
MIYAIGVSRSCLSAGSRGRASARRRTAGRSPSPPTRIHTSSRTSASSTRPGSSPSNTRFREPELATRPCRTVATAGSASGLRDHEHDGHDGKRHAADGEQPDSGEPQRYVATGSQRIAPTRAGVVRRRSRARPRETRSRSRAECTAMRRRRAVPERTGPQRAPRRWRPARCATTPARFAPLPSTYAAPDRDRTATSELEALCLRRRCALNPAAAAP